MSIDFWCMHFRHRNWTITHYLSTNFWWGRYFITSSWHMKNLKPLKKKGRNNEKPLTLDAQDPILMFNTKLVTHSALTIQKSINLVSEERWERAYQRLSIGSTQFSGHHSLKGVSWLIQLFRQHAVISNHKHHYPSILPQARKWTKPRH